MKNIYKLAVTAMLIIAGVAGALANRVSGTLPVIYINTEGGKDITDKENYITADCWLDPMNTDFEALGSREEPLLLEIRGRGNWTWVGFDKKPYKLKFDKKQKPCGMKKSKHFVLLAHADDELGFMRNTLGFELSRRIGMPWTPAQQPVELVLNGDYRGLYFLTENIRVDEDRVNIVEQKDNITHPDSITGGWLVEIDNYDSDPHITIPDVYRQWGTDLFFTYKTPEVLSKAQEQYLTDQMQTINDMFVYDNKSSREWEKYVDIDQLVRYYIVQELLDDCESFHGSCYLYKDLGEGEKWKFGPVWDFGNSYRRGESYMYIYERPPYGQAWISEIAKFNNFKSKLYEVWADFIADGLDGINTFLTDFKNQIKAAAQNDYLRWPGYGNQDLDNDCELVKFYLEKRANWLGEQWGAKMPEPDPEPDPVPNPDQKTIYLRGDHNSWQPVNPFTYVEEEDLYYIINLSIEPRNGITRFKVADEEWGSINLGSNGNKLIVGQKYWLQSGTNDNIETDYELRNVDFIVDLKEPSLLVVESGTVGIGSANAPKGELSIVGNTVYADGDIRVFDATGRLVARGRNSLTVDASGFMIVTAGGKTQKHIF